MIDSMHLIEGSKISRITAALTIVVGRADVRWDGQRDALSCFVGVDEPEWRVRAFESCTRGGFLSFCHAGSRG